MIILHSKHSSASKAFVEAYSEGHTVIAWYDNPEAQVQYLLSGQPQPSGFPFVVHQGRGFANPPSPQWVEDEVAGKHLTEQQKLDAFTLVSKLQLYEALETMPEEMQKFQIIMQNEEFATKFGLTVELDLNHPKTKEALAMVQMDVVAIKRKILGL